jgi:hypothetical protein
MAHGFPAEMLEEVVTMGLANASPEEMRIARRRRKSSAFGSPRRGGRRRRNEKAPRRSGAETGSALAS